MLMYVQRDARCKWNVVMSSYQPVTNDTFIVRVWRETSSGTWRGQIVHVPGQESVYFATPDQALAFMNRFVPGIAPQSDTPEAGGDAGGHDPVRKNDE